MWKVQQCSEIQLFKNACLLAKIRGYVFTTNPRILVARASLLSHPTSKWFFCGFIRPLYCFHKATRHGCGLIGSYVKANPPDIPRSFNFERQSFVKPFVSSCAFLGQTNAEFHCSVLAHEHRGLQYR